MLLTLAISETRRDNLNEATAFYAKQLGDKALTHLAERGIADAADSFQLGQVCNPMPGHEKYVGRLVIPYLTQNGVVSLKFRRLNDEEPTKYFGLPGQQPRLYNVPALQARTPHVAIVEGEIDAIVLTHLVGVPAVAVPGASTWRDHWPRCFADFETVYLMFDNDAKENGQNPGQSAAHKIMKTIPHATNIVPPEGLDVNEWVMRDGVDTVRKHIGV